MVFRGKEIKMYSARLFEEFTIDSKVRVKHFIAKQMFGIEKHTEIVYLKVPYFNETKKQTSVYYTTEGKRFTTFDDATMRLAHLEMRKRLEKQKLTYRVTFFQKGGDYSDSGFLAKSFTLKNDNSALKRILLASIRKELPAHITFVEIFSSPDQLNPGRLVSRGTSKCSNEDMAGITDKGNLKFTGFSIAFGRALENLPKSYKIKTHVILQGETKCHNTSK
jgi:hypothetical protein